MSQTHSLPSRIQYQPQATPPHTSQIPTCHFDMYYDDDRHYDKYYDDTMMTSIMTGTMTATMTSIYVVYRVAI